MSNIVRTTRLQGAILEGSCVLLVQHREHAGGRAYWLLPGGGAEVGEADEQALRREIEEETHLEVAVERLLFDDPIADDAVYTRFRTYLCNPLSGVAQAGAEPEPDVAAVYAIDAVMWLELREESTWPPAVTSDRLTYPLLKRLQAELGYTAGS